jgi:TrmH family RNA methyltransferase
MLSRSAAKYIRSLAQQKYRKEHKAYTAEGDKLVKEWLKAPQPLQYILALDAWADAHGGLIARHPEARLVRVSAQELAAVSSLQTPNQALLVAPMPEAGNLPASEWCLALDRLQDPGNMGTIIRIADWFGIRHIVASAGSADFYNPKVVQAGMGGHLRVQLHTAALQDFLDQVSIPVLAAVLGGRDVHAQQPLDAAVLLIGNESQGLHPDLIARATQQLTIPRLGGAESLNAAVSAGIFCSLLKRN